MHAFGKTSGTVSRLNLFCIVFQDVIEDLKALGQKEKPAKRIFTVVNAVEKEDGCINAVSDLRKLGEPAGY